MKLVLLATGQVVMAKLFIIVLLLTSALEDVHSTCVTPQFVEYGQDGPLKCKFEGGTVGLYWYELINSTYELQIKLEADDGGNVEISGPGYLDGSFDILDGGSLMVFKVTNYHTRNFKAVHVNANYLVTENFVELVTSILSNQKFPSVSVCGGDNICFVDSNEFYNLTCSYHQSRPAVEMAWYRQSHEGVELIGKNPSISKDGKWTFSSVFNLDVTNLINGPLIAFICRVSSPALNSITMESAVAIYTNERKWQELVQANRTETFHSINTSAEVFCSKAGRNQLLLWKELREGYSEARVLYINGMEKYLSNFTSDWRISREGSIVVDRMAFASQGLYTCISTNKRQYYTMENEVTVQVPPTPPFIVADGCPLENKHCTISLQAENDLFSISCTVKGVYPRIDIGMEGNYFSKDTNVITQIQSARDGQTYDAIVKVQLHQQECGMVQNVTCFINDSKRLQMVSNKTITIHAACVTKNSKALAVIIPMLIISVLSITILLVVIYYQRKKQNQNFQKFNEKTGETKENAEDTLSGENSNAEEEKNHHKKAEMEEVSASENTPFLEEGPEKTIEVDTQLNKETGETKKNAGDSLSEENSNVEELNKETGETKKNAGDSSSEENSNVEEGYGAYDGKATSPPFDEDVINIIYEEQFEVQTSEGEEIILSSYEIFQDIKRWNRVKEALYSITAWYKTLEYAIVLYQMTSCLEEEIRNKHILAKLESFGNDVQQVIRGESLNNLENFRKRARALVQELEETNKILVEEVWKNQWINCLQFLKGKQNIEFFKSCVKSIPTVTPFGKLIQTLFMAKVRKEVKGRILEHFDAAAYDTLDENLQTAIKGIDFTRFALNAGRAYMDRGRIEINEKQPSDGSSSKDTADLMKRINYALKTSFQTDNERKEDKKR